MIKLPPEHMRSEQLAAAAELLNRRGNYPDARDAYAEAGENEVLAFRSIPIAATRTRGILGVSAAALLYKGERLQEAREFALELIADEELPVFAKEQLAEIAAAAERDAADPSGAFVPSFDADPYVVRALVEAERLTWGHLHNPAFATEISLIDPLPHQRLAVYDHLLAQSRLRFLLADDAGAGKTIMAGLYLREMFTRRLLRRVLIVPPAGLVGNWERELRRLFALRFRIVRGAEAKKRNPFIGEDSDLLIISVDTLAGDRVFKRLQEEQVVPYDLVIFDEAHKLSADRDDDLGIDATDRYLLAEALSGAPPSNRPKDNPDRWLLDWACPHVLLLTATPHMGKDFPYYCLWRLLEPQVLTTFDAFEAQSPEWRADRFLRRTKEEMVRFDGHQLYPHRDCRTITYPLKEGALSERELYDETTRYIEKYYNLSKILNRSAIRFAMSVFQRRLASSTWAMFRSFENRLSRLDALIERVKNGELSIAELNRLSMNLDDPFEVRTGDEEEAEDGREQNELEVDSLMGVVLASSLAELEAEREEVRRLRDLAFAVYQRRDESKFEELRGWLSAQNFSQEKVLIFTEHRDTASFLVERLEQLGMGGEIATIHGGMDWKERDEQAASFNRPLSEGGARWLVATDAAAEGINLQQQCWLMVNYDIPWNPARLEQRMGRIHRYGQKHDPVLILNLAAQDTREGRVMIKLLEKLDVIRRQLKSDKVFDVIGQVFEGLSIRDLMTSLANPAAETAATTQIEGKLTKEQVEALRAREARIFGDGGDVKKHLPRLGAQQELESLRRLMPGHVAGFFAHVAPLIGLRFVGDPDGVFRFEELEPGGAATLQAVTADSTPERRGRFTVHRAHAAEAIFVHPGDPVFDLFHAALLARYPDAARTGAFFVDPTAVAPYLLHIARSSVVRKADAGIAALAREDLLYSNLFAIRQDLNGGCSLASLEHFLLLRAGQIAATDPEEAGISVSQLIHQAQTFIRGQLVARDVQQQRQQRLASRANRRAAVSRGFAGLEADLLVRYKRLKERVEQGNEKAKGPMTLARGRMKRLDERKRQALAAIDREVELIAPGGLELLAHAWVFPSAEPEDLEAYDAAIEQRAMETAIAYERSQGARVRDVHAPELARAAGLTDWPGFDLEALRPPSNEGSPGERRCIEVKGRASVGDVELSYNEWAQAATLRTSYWLYVVFDCATAYPRLLRVQDPFGRLIDRQVKVRIDDREILAAAEPEI